MGGLKSTEKKNSHVSKGELWEPVKRPVSHVEYGIIKCEDHYIHKFRHLSLISIDEAFPTAK